MRTLLLSLLFCLSAQAQCGTAPIEIINYPTTYSSVNWNLVKTNDGRLIYIPVIDNYWPSVTETYWNGQVYRNYHYSLSKTPLAAKKPLSSEEELLQVIENLKKEVAELKELNKTPEAPKKKPLEGPTSPLKD